MAFVQEPMVAPMGCVLGQIAEMRPTEREGLLNAMVTMIDAYICGHNMGYAEGFKAGRQMREETK